MRKRKFIFSAVLFGLLFLASTAMAQIDQLSNMSAEWIRTGNRNAATDSTDIVVYNPAGLTQMSQGFHLNFGNQTLFRSPEQKFDLRLPASHGEKSFEQDTPDYFLPNLYGAYNKGPYSFFGGIYVPGNGAVVNYPDGCIDTQFIGALTVLGSNGMFTSFRDDYLRVSSTYLATELGIAYKVEQISLALGVRYLNAQNEIKAGATFIDAYQGADKMKLKYDTDADGYGAILGMNIAATPNLNIGLRYETRIVLDFEADIKKNDFPAELGLVKCHEKNRRDLPAMLGVGAEYKLTPKLRTEVDFNYYYQSDADWGKTSDGRDLADLAGDCWGAGCVFQYQLFPTFLVSLGTIYTQFDWKDMAAYYQSLGSFEVLYTDNWHIGTGFVWEFKKNLKFNFAVGQTIWKDANIDYVLAADNGLPPVNVGTKNSTTTVAFGFDMAF